MSVRRLGSGGVPFSDAPVVTREKACRAERSSCGGLKESTCGAGMLGHNRSRLVRLSPNADCGIIGEEKAKCQALKMWENANGGSVADAEEASYGSEVIHLSKERVRHVLQTGTTELAENG